MRTWLAVLLLAACSKGKPAPTTPTTGPVASGASCDQVSTHVIQLLPASSDASNADLVKQLAGVLGDRCAKDAWTPQARQCIFDAKELKDADACKQFLTQAQVDAVDKSMDERFPKQAEAPAAGSAPPAAEPPPPPPPAKTRGMKKKPKPAGKSGDPCEGGE